MAGLHMFDGEAIRIVRTVRGYSRRELSERSSIPVGRIGSIENGGIPKPDELQKIWCALSSGEAQ
jgi:transcriptional regulator with XRE-family HTH domain